MKLAFWGCVGLIGYTYLGYPLWLYLRSRWRPKSVRAARITPTVSIARRSVVSVAVASSIALNRSETLRRSLLRRGRPSRTPAESFC